MKDVACGSLLSESSSQLPLTRANLRGLVNQTRRAEAHQRGSPTPPLTRNLRSDESETGPLIKYQGKFRKTSADRRQAEKARQERNAETFEIAWEVREELIRRRFAKTVKNLGSNCALDQDSIPDFTTTFDSKLGPITLETTEAATNLQPDRQLQPKPGSTDIEPDNITDPEYDAFGSTHFGRKESRNDELKMGFGLSAAQMQLTSEEREMEKKNQGLAPLYDDSDIQRSVKPPNAEPVVEDSSFRRLPDGMQEGESRKDYLTHNMSSEAAQVQIQMEEQWQKEKEMEKQDPAPISNGKDAVLLAPDTRVEPVDKNARQQQIFMAIQQELQWQREKRKEKAKEKEKQVPASISNGKDKGLVAQDPQTEPMVQNGFQRRLDDFRVQGLDDIARDSGPEAARKATVFEEKIQRWKEEEKKEEQEKEEKEEEQEKKEKDPTPLCNDFDIQEGESQLDYWTRLVGSKLAQTQIAYEEKQRERRKQREEQRLEMDPVNEQFCSAPLQSDTMTKPPQNRTSEETRERLSALFPPSFPRFRVAESLNDIGAYLANASYVISLGGTPVPEIKYGIIAVPLGQEKLLFGEHLQKDIMTPDFLQVVRDAQFAPRVNASLHSLDEGADQHAQRRFVEPSETEQAVNGAVVTTIIDPGVRRTATRASKRKQRDEPAAASDGETKAAAILSGPARGQELDAAEAYADSIKGVATTSDSPNPKRRRLGTTGTGRPSEKKPLPRQTRKSLRVKAADQAKEPTKRVLTRPTRGRK